MVGLIRKIICSIFSDQIITDPSSLRKNKRQQTSVFNLTVSTEYYFTDILFLTGKGIKQRKENK